MSESFHHHGRSAITRLEVAHRSPPFHCASSGRNGGLPQYLLGMQEGFSPRCYGNAGNLLGEFAQCYWSATLGRVVAGFGPHFLPPILCNTASRVSIAYPIPRRLSAFFYARISISLIQGLGCLIPISLHTLYKLSPFHPHIPMPSPHSSIQVELSTLHPHSLPISYIPQAPPFLQEFRGQYPFIHIPRLLVLHKV